MLNDLKNVLGFEATWPVLALAGVAVLLAAAIIVALVAGVRSAARRWSGTQLLIGVAIAAAFGVAGIGGYRSFDAVSQRFDSALVPLVADGMIVACTALRLAALTRGWRLPGSLLTTYVFIGGTVWLNVASAHDVSDAIAHALAPIAYSALVEMLAHMLRLHLRLAQPSRPRLNALTWFTSPVVTTRVWLHLARTGRDDPVAARALVQQVVRMSSRLQTICPSKAWWPLGRARAARSAALQTIRDGLLSAGDLAALLPETGRLAPGALLAVVDGAALRRITPATNHATGAPGTDRTGSPGPVPAPQPEPVHPDTLTGPAESVHPNRAPDPAPVREPHSALGARAARTDDELVAELHRHSQEHCDGRPLSGREVRRVLGVGTSKARRLAGLAGWAQPTNTEQPAPESPQLSIVHIDANSNDHDTDTHREADLESDSESSDKLEASTTR